MVSAAYSLTQHVATDQRLANSTQTVVCVLFTSGLVVVAAATNRPNALDPALSNHDKYTFPLQSGHVVVVATYRFSTQRSVINIHCTYPFPNRACGGRGGHQPAQCP
jgi:hypothetical protein